MRSINFLASSRILIIFFLLGLAICPGLHANTPLDSSIISMFPKDVTELKYADLSGSRQFAWFPQFQANCRDPLKSAYFNSVTSLGNMLIIDESSGVLACSPGQMARPSRKKIIKIRLLAKKLIERILGTSGAPLSGPWPGSCLSYQPRKKSSESKCRDTSIEIYLRLGCWIEIAMRRRSPRGQ